MAKETFYFSHDHGARNDPKLQKVLMVLKQEGKGVYWDLVEMLYEEGGYLLLSEIDSYSFALRTTPELIKRLISEFDLFEKDENKFWSTSILSRLKKRKEKVLKAKKSAKARWEKVSGSSERNANALRPQSDGNAIKERKVKENKEKDIKKNVPLVVAPATTDKPSRKDYDKIVQEYTDKDMTTVVSVLKDFLAKRPEFVEPYRDYWNLAVQKTSIPQCSVINDSRLKKLKTRIMEPAFDFVEIIRKVRESNKLKHDSNWFSFDWVFENDKNYLKILEGNYSG